MNAFQFRQDKTVCKLKAYVAINKATNGHPDIKQENDDNLRTYLNVSASHPPSRRSVWK